MLDINATFAQESDEWKFSIGPGVILAKNQRINNQYSRMNKATTIRFVPFFEAKNRRFSLGANGIQYRVWGDFFQNVSLVLNYTGDRYKTDQMDKRSSSFFSGLQYKYRGYSLDFVHDINNKSNGNILKGSYAHMNQLSEKWILISNVGFNWFDDRYANYYYGVKNKEVTSTRSAYKLKNYFQPVVGFLPIYKINEHFTATIGGFFKYVPNEVSKSPTMKGNQFEFLSVWGFSYNL